MHFRSLGTRTLRAETLALLTEAGLHLGLLFLRQLRTLAAAALRTETLALTTAGTHLAILALRTRTLGTLRAETLALATTGTHLIKLAILRGMLAELSLLLLRKLRARSLRAGHLVKLAGSMRCKLGHLGTLLSHDRHGSKQSNKQILLHNKLILIIFYLAGSRILSTASLYGTLPTSCILHPAPDFSVHRGIFSLKCYSER